MITPIEKISPIISAEPTGNAANTQDVISFGNIFESAIQNVRDTSKEASEAGYLLATGQLDNPAVAGIAGTKYQIAVDLLVQLRNRAFEAYTKITQINM